MKGSGNREMQYRGGPLKVSKSLSEETRAPSIRALNARRPRKGSFARAHGRGRPLSMGARPPRLPASSRSPLVSPSFHYPAGPVSPEAVLPSCDFRVLVPLSHRPRTYYGAIDHPPSPDDGGRLRRGVGQPGQPTRVGLAHSTGVLTNFA